MSFAKPVNLTREQVNTFETEVNAIRDGVMNNLGQTDVDHMRRMIRICRASEVAGRALLQFGPGPISWVAGVLALQVRRRGAVDRIVERIAHPLGAELAEV